VTFHTKRASIRDCDTDTTHTHTHIFTKSMQFWNLRAQAAQHARLHANAQPSLAQRLQANHPVRRFDVHIGLMSGVSDTERKRGWFGRGGPRSDSSSSSTCFITAVLSFIRTFWRMDGGDRGRLVACELDQKPLSNLPLPAPKSSWTRKGTFFCRRLAKKNKEEEREDRPSLKALIA
jgi:hypothetical protein